MQCQHCGQFSDWIGNESGWSPVNTASPHSLFECEQCGNKQHAHG